MKKRPELHAYVRLYLTLARELHRLHKGDTCKLGNSSRFRVACAVYVGTVENKLPTATKIADYAGVARPTALRLLQKLQDENIVERIGDNYRIRIERIMRTADYDLTPLRLAVRDANNCAK